MPLFTDAGIQKLNKFQRDIEVILDTTWPEAKDQNSPSSDYSKQIARNAIEIISALKANNNATISDFKSLKKLMGNLEALIGHIDDQNFTGIPAVFNQESAKLAEAFITFLKSLNYKEDLGAGISALIGLKGLGSTTKPDQALQQHIVEVEAKLRFYQKMASAESLNKQSAELIESIYNCLGDADKKTGTLLFRLKNNEFKDEATFKKEYEDNMRRFMEEMKNFPYTVVRTDYRRYVNAAAPYLLDPADLMPNGIGYKLAEMFRSYEEQANKLLAEKKWSGVDTVQKELDAIFTVDAVKARKKAILDLYNEFHTQKMKYQKGGHLGMFQSVDPRKVQLMEDVYTAMKTGIEKQIPDYANVSLLEVFKILNQCANQNVDISKSKAIGECGRILRDFEFRVLDMMLDGTWGHDEKFYLKMHPKPPVPAAPGPQKK